MKDDDDRATETPPNETVDDREEGQLEVSRSTPVYARIAPALGKIEWRLFGMILVVKSLFYVYGTQAYQVFVNETVGDVYGWLGLWNRWDAIHFLNVAQHGYQTTATSDARLKL